MKLEKFDKNKKQKRVVIASIIGILLIVGGITLYKTFALYEEKQEFNVLKGKIPEFVYGDVQLAFTIDGETSTGTFPNKGDGYKINNVTCENGVTAEWNNYEWGLVNVNTSNNKKVKCSIDFVTATSFSDLVKIGDYVRMTPTSTSYTIPASLTGYSEDQTINPSELKLWRVIRINEDGTIEMVSEYVSSTEVYFRGETGYQNLVGTLNLIASTYGNSKYTIATRHMGYNGQTTFITDASKLTYPAPWTVTTSDNNNEIVGGGDTLYETDTNLVMTTLGTLAAYKANETSTEPTNYWLASRHYAYYREDRLEFSGRTVSVDGSTSLNGVYYYKNGQWMEFNLGPSVRPIITLKYGVNATSGTGTTSSPWMLS